MANKAIVVTGATGGVGSDTVKFFLEKKWIVFGLARNADKLSLLTNEVNNNNFYGIQMDVKNYLSVYNAFIKIKSIHSYIDILVNNASIFKSKSFVDFTPQEIEDIIDTNLKGTIYCSLECIKCMIEGRIINISSVSGTHGIPNQTIYSASKYGVNGFSEALNQELIKRGIKISTIIPGGINTPLWDEANPYSGNVADILQPSDIVPLIYYISELPKHVVLKNVTVFPTCEWH